MRCHSCLILMNFSTQEKKRALLQRDHDLVYDIYRCPKCGHQDKEFAYYEKRK